MVQASTSFARDSYCIRLRSQQPLLVGRGATFGAGKSTKCTTGFVQKYAFNTKAGIV